MKCDRRDREVLSPTADRDSLYYKLSDKFTLSTAGGNQLYTVTQVLKRLVSV